ALVHAGRGQVPAVGTPGHRIHPVRRLAERVEAQAGDRVPDLHRPVRGRGGEQPSVWAERHTVDRVAVVLECAQLFASAYVPKFDRGVVTARGQDFTVRTPG